MIISREELKKEVAGLLQIPAERLSYRPLAIKGSMTGQIEDGFDGSIFCLSDGEREYVAKLKRARFAENVCMAMNVRKQPDFEECFRQGYRVFCIEESYLREKYVYTALSEAFPDRLPRYYGSTEQDGECVHLMERIDIRHQPINDRAVAEFAADLHARYLGDAAFCRDKHLYFATEEDYLAAVPLTERLFENLAALCPQFPQALIEELLLFARAGKEHFAVYESLPRTFCHGDLCVKNLSFLDRGACVYDWELARYDHPAHDLVSYLVHYPIPLTKETVTRFLEDYLFFFNRKSGQKMTAQQLCTAMRFHLKLYTVTRFHAMVSIAQTVEMPYMPISLGNFLFLSVFPFGDQL